MKILPCFLCIVGCATMALQMSTVRANNYVNEPVYDNLEYNNPQYDEPIHNLEYNNPQYDEPIHDNSQYNHDEPVYNNLEHIKPQYDGHVYDSREYNYDEPEYSEYDEQNFDELNHIDIHPTFVV